ncbi:hypothetical protein P4O66_016870 [Electrophorus voltai]|uniref:Ig-like domain-containing protein n=1 Tax=Electrophorus voltai TaxID=2609070 RepID=A0AAD8YYW7_9TELE|nr:hypothetical protein P4O66_016870 [Electrophorus voltai]
MTILYPSIGSSETLNCKCPDHQCQRVFWYRILHSNDTPQFLVFCNSANTVSYGPGISATRFKTNTDERSEITYSLRITGLQKDDAGFYSCLLNSQKQRDFKELFPPGYYLRPGEHPPTLAPTVKTPKPTKPRLCRSNYQPPKGCKPLVLWPSVGVLLALAVALISTLYYFSSEYTCKHTHTQMDTHTNMYTQKALDVC